MITPAEIKEQALKWWKPFLVSYINKEAFFPKQIDRIGKVKPGDITGRFDLLQNEIKELYAHSKSAVGAGYVVKTIDKNFRRSGSHQLPDIVEFETAEDYLLYVGKKREWIKFQENYKLLIDCLPKLKEWISNNVLLLCTPNIEWKDILKVCFYFIETPRPNLYIRQLPVQIHTKFIEENSSVLQSLLDNLIPDHIRNIEQNKFAERYFLKHDEPLIRIRILDDILAVYKNITDLSIRLSDFEKNDWPCSRLLITENKMNFLTLPSVSETMAIWGSGFKVSYLKDISWLKQKTIYYWGDIDEHGFQILHQLRSYFPHTRSLMMDKETFEIHEGFAVRGEQNKAEKLSFLDAHETELYNLLKSRERNRLEQEKIPQPYIEARLKATSI
jgi:hypothetical protein